MTVTNFDIIDLPKVLPEYNFNVAYGNQEQESATENSMGTILPRSKALSVYKTEKHDQKWVYLYTRVATIIYDKYPKSTIHLLVLPYNISYVEGYKMIVANRPFHFRGKHLQALKRVHNMCRFLCKYLGEKYGLNLTAGYHFMPSMDDLHIHIISTDFSHAKTKNQKRSFHHKNFITIDKVEEELEKYGKLLKVIAKAKLKAANEQNKNAVLSKNGNPIS